MTQQPASNSPRVQFRGIIAGLALGLSLICVLNPGFETQEAGALTKMLEQEGKCQPALIKLPVNCRQWVQELNSEDWQKREQSSLKLVAQASLWLGKIPKHWQPESVEAQWRWRWVLKQVEALRELPSQVRNDEIQELNWQVHKLHAEVGAAIIPVLQEVLQEHPQPRCRARALELLANLPGLQLETALLAAERDNSAVVRRALYEVAASQRAWLLDLLLRAAKQTESEILRSEIARAVRVHRVGELLPTLRTWWSKASSLLRDEIALALSIAANPKDRQIHLWMIQTEDYRMVLSGMRAIERTLSDHSVEALLEELERIPFPGLRKRLLAGLERTTRAKDALSIVPALYSTKRELRNFASHQLVSWRAWDYLAEIQHAMHSWPQQEKFSIDEIIEGSAHE